MTRKSIAALAGTVMAGLLIVATPATVQAGPITIDSGWYGFCFDTPGPATPGCANDAGQTSGNAFTFNALAPVLLKVTDAFLYGDIFDVYDGLTFLFTTSPSAIGGGVTTDPDLAFADPLYSSGSILLAAGAHAINIFNTSGPVSGGGAYMEVETAVPEPVTLALVGGGLLGLAFRRRRA